MVPQRCLFGFCSFCVKLLEIGETGFFTPKNITKHGSIPHLPSWAKTWKFPRLEKRKRREVDTIIIKLILRCLFVFFLVYPEAGLVGYSGGFGGLGFWVRCSVGWFWVRFLFGEHDLYLVKSPMILIGFKSTAAPHLDIHSEDKRMAWDSGCFPGNDGLKPATSWGYY